MGNIITFVDYQNEKTARSYGFEYYLLLDIFLLPYRNDQNVLSAGPTKYRLISTEEGEMKYTKGPIGEYITDSGLIVPAISYELRERYVYF